MAGQAKVYFKVDNDTTAFGIDLQINSFVYDIDKNELWNIDAAADATDTLTTIAKTQVNASGAGSGDVVGPAGATDGNVAVFDTATGKKIKDGGRALASMPYSGDAADTLADAYTIPFWNTVASAWKKITWANIQVALNSLFAKKDLSNIDISGLDEETTPADDDLFVMQQVDGTIVKVKKENVGGGGGAVTDADVTLTETYTNNLAGATTQKEANDVLDAFSGGVLQAEFDYEIWQYRKNL